jgi:hypothetical protein
MCLSDFWTGYAKPYQSGPYLWSACFDAGTPITINFADVEIEYILAMSFLL